MCVNSGSILEKKHFFKNTGAREERRDVHCGLATFIDGFAYNSSGVAHGILKNIRFSVICIPKPIDAVENQSVFRRVEFGET